MTSTDRKFIVHVSLEIVILGTMGYFFYNKSKMLEERLKKLEDLMIETQGSLKVLLNNKPEPENQLEKQLQRLELEKKVQKGQKGQIEEETLVEVKMTIINHEMVNHKRKNRILLLLPLKCLLLFIRLIMIRHLKIVHHHLVCCYQLECKIHLNHWQRPLD